MNYLIKIVSIFILILLICMPAAYAKGAHSGSHVSAPKSTTISGAKTYTTSSKYNASNIKTSKVQEASNYHNYSSTNIFTPNVWTAMWAFQCMHDNTEKVTEQDIAKELEERGYTQEEIQEILKEGEEAKQAEEKQNEEDNKIAIYVVVGMIGVIIILFIIAIIFA